MTDRDRLAERRAALPPAAREALARRLRGASAATGTAPAPAASGDTAAPGEAPLSFTQEGFWLRQRRYPQDAAGNVFAAVRLRGPLDTPALRRACDALVARHDVLRSRFTEVDGEPRQIVVPGLRLPLREADLQPGSAPPDGAERDTPGADRRLERLAAREAARPFDLETAPPVRALLARLGTDHHVLMLTLHHVATDARSNTVLLEELAALYAAQVEGAAVPTLPPAPQIADVARDQRARRRGAAFAGYWRQVLDGAPPLDLPLDRPRVPGAPRVPGRVTATVPAEDVDAMRDLCRQDRVPLFAGLTAVLQTLLHRYSGSTDHLIGVPFNGRDRPDLLRVVGPLFTAVPLRADLSGRPTFRELASRVRGSAATAFDHAQVPAERFGAAAYDVLFALQDAPAAGTAEVAGVAIEPLELGPGTAQCTLTLSAVPVGRALHVTADHDSRVLDRVTAAQMLRHFVALVRTLARFPDEPVDTVDLLTGTDRAALLRDWNSTAAPAVLPRVVHEAFAHRARLAPDAPAVRCGDEHLTYGQLHLAALGCARALGKAGVGRGDIVGVSVERTPALAVALLGVLMAGAAYLPLDPSYPDERRRHALTDAGARHLLHGHDPRSRPAAPGVRVLGPADWAVPPDTGQEPPPARVGPADVAYAMYTSGSTGTPKGVLVAHEGVANDLDWRRAVTGIGPGDRLLHTVSCSFDPSVWQLFGPLATGAEVVLATEEELGDPERVAALIRDHRVTIADFVPSTLARVLDAAGPGDLDSLTHAFCGGERLPRDLAERFHQRTGAALRNQYGPTEATIDTTSHPVRPGAARREVPIGRLIGNKRGYVLDAQLRPVPARVPGELWIGGTGLAYGYVGSPAQTADRFRPDPYGPPGARMYRSGDLVRHRHDGDLEFVGRIDQQVKLNGVRIEPAEVEAALRAHPDVTDAAVVPRRVQGRTALVAYAVTAAGAAFDRSVLRAHLLRRLPPAYMPAHLEPVPDIPREVTGKLAVGRLPEPGRSARTGPEWRAGAGSVEEEVARIWLRVLGREPAAPDEDFFECGGDSVLATRLVASVRERFGTELNLHDFFVDPTLAGLAALLPEQGAPREPSTESPTQASGPVLVRTGADRAPLSHAQERVLGRAEAGAGPDELEVASSVRLTGPIDADALARAVSAVVARHEALRVAVTATDRSGGRPTQTVRPPFEVPLARTDLSGRDGAALSAALDRLDRESALDLDAGVLIAPTLLRTAPDEHVLHLKLHRIAVDGRSADIVAHDLAHAYRIQTGGQEAGPPAPRIGHPDYALWERARLTSGDVADAVRAWQETASDLDALTRAPAAGSGARSELRWSLGGPRTRALDAAAAALRCTRRTLLLSVWSAACEHRFGRPVPICVPVAGRDHPWTHDVVGRFVDLAPVWTAPLRREPLGERVRRTHAAAVQAYGRRNTLPFGALERSLQEAAGHGGPVFPVFFDLADPVGALPTIPGVAVTARPAREPRSDFGLALLAEPGADGLDVAVLHDPAAHPGPAADALFGDVRARLTALADHYRLEN
ncbi:amino acid adenylation domain-containing protein [Nocardiopsis aegyptia]|uniref:amino acid adenylation domain-containing protein n=1 Tax=Nocardiopsis aegyptia TaxID=220378 RepID=UPI00367242FC